MGFNNYEDSWQGKYDPIFGIGFRDRFTPEYIKMLRQIGPSLIKVKGSAVIGFHFSPAAIDKVNPKEGKLWMFLNRPSLICLNEIAVLPITKKGWAGNNKNVYSNNPKFVFCYEIYPSEKTSEAIIKVKQNGLYGSNHLLGLEVRADDSCDWNVVDKKVMVVENGRVVH